MTTTTPHGQVPEALRLAEAITNMVCSSETAAKTIAAAADELCRLHAENEALRVQQRAASDYEAGWKDGYKHGAWSTQQRAPATQKLKEQICISDTNQSAACAVGSVGTTPDAQTTRSTHDAPATQQVGEVVAYLDVGANGYLDLGSDLSEDALQQLPKGRHALVIAGTYGIDGYVAAPQPSPTTKPAPQPAPAPLSDDTKRLDWLDRNIFSREMSEWDAKYGHGPDYNMWVVFSPKGVQGSARNIIDAAIAAQGGKA